MTWDLVMHAYRVQVFALYSCPGIGLNTESMIVTVSSCLLNSQHTADSSVDTAQLKIVIVVGRVQPSGHISSFLLH